MYGADSDWLNKLFKKTVRKNHSFWGGFGATYLQHQTESSKFQLAGDLISLKIIFESNRSSFATSTCSIPRQAN